jgi:ABC-type Fe3+/spermidine/putrescine transport system ATPase subunit
VAENLTLTNVVKRFGHLMAVDHLNLDVQEGEFLTLLGPSGCGKSTTLRLIAGLERPNEGTIQLGDRILSSGESRVFTPPEKRGMGMVFQSYAVWPHMTVAQNVGFPLHLRRVPRAEQQERVSNALRMVGLEGLESRGATQLSGGQQQRVALARALVHNPSVLLLDEPLSNLDAKLREQMRLELRLLQRRLQITTIFVTHDQAEAMVLSDRIVVMNHGHVEQIGGPDEIYERPNTRFVMDFVGRVNYLQGVARFVDGATQIHCDGANVSLSAMPSDELVGDERVTLCIRPEDVSVLPLTAERQATDWPATIQAVTYLGHRVEYLLTVGSVTLMAEGAAAARLSEGDEVQLRIPREAIRAWTRDNEGDRTAVAVGAGAEG